MKTTICAALLILATIPAHAQVATAEELALVEQVKADIAAIDEELITLRDNQAEFDQSPGMRRDEYNSLITRYPEMKITPTSTASQFYAALIAKRKERAALALPIMKRQLADSNVKLCVALAKARKAFEDLAATDDYKRMTLKDRLLLRSSVDDLINVAKGRDLVCP